jgi:hypothetical protein
MSGTVAPSLRILVLFELVIGLTAGLTVELVFTKLRGRDALEPSAWKPEKA